MATWEKVELLTPNFFSSFSGGAAAFDEQDDFAITNTISNGDCIVTFQKPIKDYQWLEIEVQALSSSGELSVVSFFRDMAGLTGPLESFGAQIYGQGITTFVVPYVGILEGFSWSHVFGSIKIHSIRAISRNAGITLFDNPATVSGTFAGWTPTGVVGQYYKDVAAGTVASGSVNFNNLLLDYCYLKIEVNKAFSTATINIRGQVCNSNTQLQEFYFDQLETSPKNITVTAGADIGCRVTVTVKRAKFPAGISAFGSATPVNQQTSGQANGAPSAIFSLVNVWTALNTFLGGIALIGTGYVHANGSAAPVSYFSQIPASDIAGLGSMALESTVNWAPKNNAALTGVPTAPTATPGTSTGQLATTAFVTAAVAASTAGVSQFNGRTGAVTLSLADVNAAVLAGGPLSIGAASWSSEQLQVSAAGSASIGGRSATAITSGASFFGLDAYATHDGSLFTAGGTINFRAEEAWTVSAKGTYIQFRTITAGTTVLSEKMRLSSAGNLGVGTSPAYKFHVLVADATVCAVFDAPSGYVRIRPYVNPTTGGDICGLNGGGYAPLTISGSPIRLMGAGTAGLTVSSSGNVGIGLDPTYPLHVRAAADRILQVRSAFSGQDGITLTSGNDADNAFKTLTLEGSNVVLNLATGGNVGIGVIPSVTTIHPLMQFLDGGMIGSVGNNINLLAAAYYSSGWKYASNNAGALLDTENGAWVFYNAPTGVANAALTWTQRAKLDITGNFTVAGGFRSTTNIANGINIAQTGNTSTTSPPGSLEGGTRFNVLTVSENITGNSIAGSVFLNALYIGHVMDGTQNSGGRNTFEVALHKACSTRSDNTTRFYCAAAFTAEAAATDGGSFGAELGAIFGLNAVGRLMTAGTNYANLTGAEFNVEAWTGSSIRYKSGIQVCGMAGDAVQGSAFDAAISLSSIAGAVGWKTGILFSAANGQGPMHSGGSMIQVQGLATCYRAVDITTYSFTDWAVVLVNNTTASSAGNGLYVETKYNATAAGRVFQADCANIEQFHIDSGTTNPITLRTGGLLRAIEVGAADSAGVGYRTLRVAN